MNRFVVLAAIAGFVLLSATSCKKCTQCTVLDKYDRVDSALEDVETCGNESDVEEAEQRAYDYATAIQGSAECIRQ